ncbi:MAG: ATPase [Bacteroidetes bacterium]|nr:MAG: ATPase [Bacteroidota bacterium]
MILRKNYIEKIIGFINKPVVKVISGIRRSGKSVILLQLQDELKKRGVPRDKIIYLNFESFRFADIVNAADLYRYVKEKIKSDKRHYLFFDEIQEVKGWEKAVNSFRVDFNSDIYITGSNSHLLSSELSTYLAGRYVQFNIYPLSFSEFLLFRQNYSAKDKINIFDDFYDFLRLGGFPVVHTTNSTRQDAYKIIYDIYSSVILRDVVQRYKIRDIELLDRIVKFVFNNIGNTFSAKKVSDYFKSQNRRVDISTVYNYIKALESSFIIYRINRYNIQGKEILKTNEKYFIGDHALLYALMGFKDTLISGILENIVMLELKRRGYETYIGKLDNFEVDFIAEKQGKKIYVQVAYKMTEKETLEREYKPLLKIKDNYPKYVVTTDRIWNDNVEGIEHFHIADFLLKKSF